MGVYTGKSYDEIKGLIANLRQSAIDAWMVEAGFAIEGDYYHQVLPSPGTGVSTEELVDRPKQGEGGGTGTSVATSVHGGMTSREVDYTAEFNSLRRRIDEIVLGQEWDILPEPQHLDGSRDDCKALWAELASEGEEDKGSVTASSGSIGVPLKSATDSFTAENATGEAMDTFRLNVLSRIPIVLNNLRDISASLGSVIIAEQRAMDTAREATANLIGAAEDNCAKLASNLAAARHEIQMKFASAVIDTVSDFTGGWKSGALGVASNGLEFAINVGEINEKYDLTGTTLDSILGDLYKGLNEISRELRTTEETIHETLRKNVDAVRMDIESPSPKYYMLSLGSINPQDVDDNAVGPSLNTTHEVLLINPPVVTSVYHKDLPAVASAIAAVENDPYGLEIAMNRGSTIGLADSGPKPYFYELTGLLGHLLKDLELKVRWAATELRLVVEVVQAADQDVAGAMDELERIAGDDGIIQQEQRERRGKI